MRLFAAWQASKGRTPLKTASSPTARRVLFEPLEPRLALATLGLGIRVREDDNGVPGAERTTPLIVGSSYWVEVIAEDQRAGQQGSPQGVISLPLDLSWDSDNLSSLNPPTTFFPTPLPLPAPFTAPTILTADLPLGRFVDSFQSANGHTGFAEPPVGAVVPPANPTIGGLRGAALPNAGPGNGQAVGVPRGNPVDPHNVGFFSQLRFTAAAAADDTPLTIELAGSMSFTDGATLDGIACLSAAVIQNRPSNRPCEATSLAVTEFIDIMGPAPPESSLSGFVYADTNLNGVLDTAADGTPLEIGLPNVVVSLFRGQDSTPIQTTTTGPDGWYHFENLAPATYRIVETQPGRYVNSLNAVGVVCTSPPAGGCAPRGVVGPAVDQLTSIVLGTGEQGIDYNFGENVIPTKDALRSRTIPRVTLNAQLGLRTAVVRGTDSADQIAVEVTGPEIAVTVNNGAARVFERANVDVVVVDGQAANDVITMTGTDEAETAQLLPNQASLRVGNDFLGTNYGVLAAAAEQATVTAGTGGSDLAVVRDTRQTSDTVVASGNQLQLSAGTGRISRALGFGRVRAVTTAPSGGSEADDIQTGAIDYILSLAGNWI